MTESQQKAFSDIGDDSKEHAEHIGAGSGDIKHQREHFQLLSKDIYDLVKAFGTTQTLYKDYCPMVKAIWLSETKPIWLPNYAVSESAPTKFLGWVSLAIGLAREVSGEAAVDRAAANPVACQCQPKIDLLGTRPPPIPLSRAEAYEKALAQRYDGRVDRCC